jgi:thymidine kinase
MQNSCLKNKERDMARLEVITGPMFSGKTEESIRRLRRATFVRKRILVVRPSTDNRGARNIFDLIKGDDKLSRYERLASRVLNHVKELRSLIDSWKPDILAIDEAQFFGPELLEYLDELLEKKKSQNFTIIVAGLDMDAWRRPFGIMPQLLAMADEVLKLTAICVACNGENPAIFTQKKGGTGEQVEVGDAGLYEARCRACYYIPSQSPA